jgi:thiamine biosynthesis lipoprotein
MVGPDAEHATTEAQRFVAHLEAMWSRFLPESDVTRLNDSAGQPVAVAAETIDLLSDAVAWWEATEGLFDPTVLAALESAGYDRDRGTGHGPITDGAPAPGCRDIQIDAEAGTVRLPAGVRIDLGGIGKGRAVDLVAEQLAHLPGGLIDLGGDLRVWGTAPEDDPGWPIAVEDLRDGTTVALLGLAEGAVATSSTLRRTWRDGERAAHHLIDPRLGRPAGGELVTVTVVAGIAAAAEVLAKAAIVTGTTEAARALLDDHGVAALVVPTRGAPVSVGGFADLCWTPPMEATR